MFRSCTRLLTVLALAIPMVSFAGHAQAQSKPHLAAGFAQFAPNFSDFTGGGHATHLGKYTEVGHVTLTPTATPGVFTADGWTDYTAANGDQLYARLTGTVDLGSGTILAMATYVGGTGRFADASGSAILMGHVFPATGAMTVEAVGSISY